MMFKIWFSFCLLIFFPLLVSAQNKASFDWKKPQYKEVRAYFFNCGKEEDERSIVKEGKLATTVENQEGILLNREQIDLVLDIVTGYAPQYFNGVSFCFEPHHGIVFYGEDNTPVAWISVCFECSSYQGFPYEYNASGNGKMFLFRHILIEQLGLPIADSEQKALLYMIDSPLAW